MIFKNPWILALIPVVLILLFWIDKREGNPRFRFSSVSLFPRSSETWKTKLNGMLFFLKAATFVLLIIALAGPRSVLEETSVKAEGIDIVLTIDSSGSMAAEDFKIGRKRYNRLEVVKNVVEDFIQARKHDRIGLIAFAAEAYTVCPLTTDYAWLLKNLKRVRLGLIKDGTAIGSAINTSLIRLKQSKAKSKIIILLTDGVNNTGKVDPLTAAKAAQALGIKIYTIGAGTKGYAPFPVQDVWGRTMYQNVRIEIDENTLRQIAQLTNAQYFRATDTESLREIYKAIDALEKTEFEELEYKEYKELFGWFLGAAGILLFLEIILANTVFLRIP